MASSKGKITRHHFVVSYSSATPESIELVFATRHSTSSSLSLVSSSSWLQKFPIQGHFVGSYSLTSPHVY